MDNYISSHSNVFKKGMKKQLQNNKLERRDSKIQKLHINTPEI